MWRLLKSLEENSLSKVTHRKQMQFEVSHTEPYLLTWLSERFWLRYVVRIDWQPEHKTRFIGENITVGAARIKIGAELKYRLAKLVSTEPMV
jgi:hypothetical protein